jgi:chromosome segregation protein
MIDDLLNDKDHSRRSLFEEAAGISKFKKRKKETLKKLHDADADLDRVEDVLYEIEKNLKSLERQAKQAKKYYEIKEDYRLLSISMARKGIFNQQETFDNTQKRITAENDKKQALNTQLLKEEAAIEKLKSDLILKEKVLATQQKSLNDHVHSIRSYENEKKIKVARQRFLQDKIDQLKNQINQGQESADRSSFAIQGLKKTFETAKNDLEAHLGSLNLLEEKFESQKQATQEGQDQLDISNQNYLTARESVFQYSKNLEIKEIQLNTLKVEIEKTNNDSSDHNNSLQEFETKVNEIVLEKEQKQTIFDHLFKEQKALDEKKKSLIGKIDLLKDEFNLVNRSLDAKQNEYSLTKSLIDNLEGFPEAIKFLKKKSQWKSTPLLSDVIACPKDYRVCIENFLEPYMNYYVFDKTGDAIDAIALLNDANKGRANFFIIELLETFKPHDILPIDSLQSATELIDYDVKYTKLITYLLHNVYIYEGNKPQGTDELVFIEKSGKIIHKTYSISGGSVGLFEGKRIGRAKNLETLSAEIKKLKHQQQILSQKLLESQNEFEQIKLKDKLVELEGLKDEINKINESYATFKTRQEQFFNLLNSNTTRKEDIQNQIKVIREEFNLLQPKQKEQQTSLIKWEQTVNEQKISVEKLNQLLASDSSGYNEANVKYHQEKNKVDRIAQEILYKEESFQNSTKRIENDHEELRNSEKDLNHLISNTVTEDDQLVEMYAQKESYELALSEVEKAYYQHRGNIEVQEKNLKEIQHNRESADQLLMEWREKLSDAKIHLNSIKDRLSVEFDVVLENIEDSDLKPEYEKLGFDALDNQVKISKTKLENMGAINPMAMEAYDEIKERHNFITTQKEDLLKAKDTLLSTIEEIDVVAKETFLSSFESIKKNFIKVFRTLFTEEDDCDLNLARPDDPLESPIDIIAKPKGKRPLTINQLSGGEKTLTATALLFAIYLIKPAPFCIFDEVDAPLDDANIDKFNQIIREFSNDSQFIIVTHNKRTMSSTDLIYGITMIEQGISKVIPVDLRALA